MSQDIFHQLVLLVVRYGSKLVWYVGVDARIRSRRAEDLLRILRWAERQRPRANQRHCPADSPKLGVRIYRPQSDLMKNRCSAPKNGCCAVSYHIAAFLELLAWP